MSKRKKNKWFLIETRDLMVHHHLVTAPSFYAVRKALPYLTARGHILQATYRMLKEKLDIFVSDEVNLDDYAVGDLLIKSKGELFSLIA